MNKLFLCDVFDTYMRNRVYLQVLVHGVGVEPVVHGDEDPAHQREGQRHAVQRLPHGGPEVHQLRREACNHEKPMFGKQCWDLAWI
ncbi:jg10438 [Pararge aegeria aegeria]|uniref:Jg10438 protein n=1 Tax=Pararge aegeria aegeria TaxID=348720 RepID=A0A8S4QWU8_9NEOP|nr:jg10438 [Pararge aegeria aegeria]